MNKRYRISLSLKLLLIISVFYGCAISVQPPSEPSLVLLTGNQLSARLFEDDMELSTLYQAIERSVSYYERIAPDQSFKYNDVSYSSQEMAASLSLFVHLTKQFQGKALQKELQEKFLFFESRNTSGNAFFTGYYEPLLDGSPEPIDLLNQPLYARPHDLIEADLGQFKAAWDNEKIFGRVEENRFVPYDTRAEIVYEDSLQYRAEPIAYVNEVELFFLQIQGSGIVRFPDGSQKRVNYDSQNGRPYRAIGQKLKDQIPKESMSLQALKEYLSAHPDEVRGILSYNESYVFFREVDEGPLGDIEVPLTPLRSIAMDRRSVPRGSLAFIETSVPVFDKGMQIDSKPIKRFVLVQDTGGAIRGHGRADIFFGHGTDAELIAGHLKSQGRVFLIIAKKEFLY
jgi:membrane-bound lytic murein transglycosylase A